MDLLTLKQTRERAAHLSTADLELLVEAQKDLRHYYKYGTYKKFTKYNKSTNCILCDTVEQIIGWNKGKCPSCPWTILTGHTCLSWYRENVFPTDYGLMRTSFTAARMERPYKLTWRRIQMLDKWTRRLNAVIARRKGASLTKDIQRYGHECKNCKFLGQYNKFDLYVCAKENKINTVLARYGTASADYLSGLDYAIAYRNGECKSKANAALAEALTRAERLDFTI